jgi:hypothetical protein
MYLLNDSSEENAIKEFLGVREPLNENPWSSRQIEL